MESRRRIAPWPLWLRRAGSVLIALLVAGFILLALLSMLEDHLLYFPSRTLEAKPSDFGLAADELNPRSADGVRLYGWHLRGRGGRALLFFHGNAGNISHRLERVRRIIDAHGFDVFLVDYRGYGLSEGKPSEEGLYADGLAVYEAARARGFSPEQIVILGESLGSAVAVELARQRPSAAVILEAPFRSIPAMAKRHYPFVPRMLISARYDNEAKVPRLTVPTLFVMADRDEIVPPDHVRHLYESHPGRKDLFVLRGAGHDGAYDAGPEYDEAWRRFLGPGPVVSLPGTSPS